MLATGGMQAVAVVGIPRLHYPVARPTLSKIGYELIFGLFKLYIVNSQKYTPSSKRYKDHRIISGWFNPTEPPRTTQFQRKQGS